MPYGITQCYLPPGRGDIPAVCVLLLLLNTAAADSQVLLRDVPRSLWSQVAGEHAHLVVVADGRSVPRRRNGRVAARRLACRRHRQVNFVTVPRDAVLPRYLLS